MYKIYKDSCAANGTRDPLAWVIWIDHVRNTYVYMNAYTQIWCISHTHVEYIQAAIFMPPSRNSSHTCMHTNVHVHTRITLKEQRVPPWRTSRCTCARSSVISPRVASRHVCTRTWKYVWLYVCMYVLCVCVCVHPVSVYVYLCLYIYLCMCVRKCVYVCMFMIKEVSHHACTRTSMYVCTLAYSMYLCMYACTNIYVCIFSCMYAFIYAYTSTSSGNCVVQLRQPPEPNSSSTFHTSLHTHTHTNAHADTHTHTYTNANADTHTHTHMRIPLHPVVVLCS
jgi:hypothetical protein